MRVERREPFDGGIQVEKFDLARRRRADAVRQGYLPGHSAAFDRRVRARVVDKNLPHQTRRDREELCTVLPPHAPQIDEADVRLVDQRSRSQ